ncbi:MAG: glutamate 5-kinase [Bacteroidota bacterium]
MIQARLKIVVKIEIAALQDENQELDTRKMDQLAMVLSNLENSGKEILVVSSGAIALGAKKMGMKEPPKTLAQKQAIAAIGQAELIKMYQRYFGEYNQIVAQVLLTTDVVLHDVRRKNATNTFKKLMDINIIPIINENDAVSTQDIIQDDNYPLVLNVAQLVGADIILVKCEDESGYIVVTRQDNQGKLIAENDLFDYLEEIQQTLFTGNKQPVFPENFQDIKVC